MFYSAKCRALTIAGSLLLFGTNHVARAQSNSSAPGATWPVQSYVTTTFHPPQLRVNKSGSPVDGYIFLAPDGPDAGEVTPLIMTDTNDLVWQGPYSHAFNFGVQQYRGEPVLVYWNGTVFPEPVGRGSGSVYILNNAYQEIAVVSLPGNFVTAVGAKFASNVDLHELYITERNTVLVTANNVTQTDLTSVGGPEAGWVVDCFVYEIDIATNEVLFEWSSLDHLPELPLSLSVYPLGSEGYNGTTQLAAWGYFHINAVSPFEGGYLISSRYLCSAIAIDNNGEYLWRLQGRDGGDFSLGPGANFCYQHDIRAQPHSSTNLTLYMHDNANCPINNGTTPSSGLVLNVDLSQRTANLNARYLNPADPIYSTAQGNFQRLSNQHIFVGSGWIPKIEEFDGSGNIVMTIQFAPGAGTLSYRAFRQPWIGCPITLPLVVAESTPSGSMMNVSMSWNGATEYDSWIVYGGNSTETLTALTTVPRTGFETQVLLGMTTYVQVEAATLSVSRMSCCANGGDQKSAVVAVM